MSVVLNILYLLATHFGIECLNGMSAASVGTPDYFHTCGYLGGFNGSWSPVIPLPMPSGMGAAGTVVMPNNVEYIGTCLPAPLVAGPYNEFSVYVGLIQITPLPATALC